MPWSESPSDEPTADPGILAAEVRRLAPQSLAQAPRVGQHLSASGRAGLARRRANDAAVIDQARRKVLASVVETWAQALEAWSTDWLRIQQAGLERQTQAVLMTEYRRLEATLRSFAEEFHAEIQRRYDDVAALQRAGAHTNVVQSHEHDVEMRLHHYHAFVSDVRDRFLAILRKQAG